MMSWNYLGPLITACSALWLLRSGSQIGLDQSLGDQTAPNSTPHLQGRTRTMYSTVTALVNRERSPWKSSLVFCYFCHFGKLPNQLTWHSVTHTECIGEESKKVLECVNLEGLQSFRISKVNNEKTKLEFQFYCNRVIALKMGG